MSRKRRENVMLSLRSIWRCNLFDFTATPDASQAQHDDALLLFRMPLKSVLPQFTPFSMNFLHQLHTPEGQQNLIRTGGYLILMAIIFAETGLLVGFIFPGDSLLFIAGFMASPATKVLHIEFLIPLLILAAIAGDSTGYFIGRKVGPALFARGDGRLVKRKHLERAQAFYEQHGPKAIILARFVPVVRAFATTVAGAAEMPYKTFLPYSVCGAAGWVSSMTLLGYFLGNVPIVQRNLEKAVILIVLLSISPIIIHALKDRKAAKARAEAALQPRDVDAGEGVVL